MCLGEIGRIVEVRPGSVGIVATPGRTVEASLVTLDDAVVVGDWVVVHSGFALERLGADEAAEALALRAGAFPPPVFPAPARAGRSAATAAPRTPREGSA
ncbi:MAG: HypC/HybG/HupF family hydrogenase formation chaperone [Cellulomonas sp.]